MVTINEREVKLEIWDTVNSSLFYSVFLNYLRQDKKRFYPSLDRIIVERMERYWCLMFRGILI